LPEDDSGERLVGAMLVQRQAGRYGFRLDHALLDTGGILFHRIVIGSIRYFLFRMVRNLQSFGGEWVD
jgi:hypothetical protein